MFSALSERSPLKRDLETPTVEHVAEHNRLRRALTACGGGGSECENLCCAWAIICCRAA